MAITFSQLGMQGRLGNQLFQLFSTIGTALKNNDTYIFPPWKYEPFFNLHGCFSTQLNFTSTYQEPHFHYTPVPYQSNLNLSGYFQSPKYWAGHETTIKNLLTPNHNLPQNNMTSIHVRRTDYLKSPQYHTILDMNYYNRAMQLCPSEKYMIFSDDITWCKSNFLGNKFVFSEGKSEVEDLILMMTCSNNIIAASSFSYWAGYLNTNPNKQVIYPRNWLGTAAKADTKDLIPTDQNWAAI